MRLLMLSPTFDPHRGGAESLAADLAALFVERGHAVTVLTASGEPSEVAEIQRGARVLRVRYPDASPRSFAKPARWLADAQMRRWHRRLLRGGGRDGAGGGAIAAVDGGAIAAVDGGAVTAADGGAIDAVAVLRVDESCRYVLAQKRRLGFRLAIYLHGGELRSLQRESARFRAVLRRAMRRADVIVAVSADLEREALAFEPSVAGKVRCIPNGIDVAAVAAATPTVRARPFALFAGRLERVKNPRFAVAAFARAAAELATNPGLDLVLAGVGSEEAALAELVAELGLAGRVHLLGGLARAEVYGLMKGAACLVVPSLAEGHPLVVLEAWAAGVPVLASDVKGLRGLVDDAMRFPLDDGEALARLLVRTVRAKDHQNAGGDEPRVPERDVRGFDLRTLVDRHLTVILGSP